MSLTAQKYTVLLTVLLLSAPLGSGHKMAAEALEEAFKKHDNVKVVNGSAFDFFPKWLGNIILGGYIGILKHVPKLYDIAYRWSNTGNLEQHRQRQFMAARLFKFAAVVSGAGLYQKNSTGRRNCYAPHACGRNDAVQAALCAQFVGRRCHYRF